MKMSLHTQVKILNLLDVREQGVGDLAKTLKISNQIVHRHIKELLGAGFILKEGKAPLTRYRLNPEQPYTRVASDFDYTQEYLLPEFRKKYKIAQVNKKKKNDYSLDFMIKSSAVYSSNIEGVSINVNSFNQDPKLFDRHTQKEIAEVQDLVDAYEYAKSQRLNEKNLLKVHTLLSRHLLTKSRQGSYRNERIGVFGSEGLVYLGIEEVLVAHEMSKLFNIIKELLSKKLSITEAVFWASWVHLELALIHPFLDGNGRTARLLEKWFLAESVGDNSWILQTEEFYFRNRTAYYKNLKLGAHYWDVSMNKSKTFLSMLAQHPKC